MVWPIIAGLLAGGGGAAAGAGAAGAGAGLGGLFSKIMGGASKFGGLLKEGVGSTAYNMMDAIPDDIYDGFENIYKTFTDPNRTKVIDEGRGEKDAMTPDALPGIDLPQMQHSIPVPTSFESFMKIGGGQQRQPRQRTAVSPIVSGYLKGLLGGG